MSYKDELKYDYLSYVRGLESAIGIYLRREVLEIGLRADAPLRKRLYHQTVAAQSSDGSWNQSFVQTANSLWNLALLGYAAKDRRVEKGLEWLLSIQRHVTVAFPASFLLATEETRA
jgi:hypothetical protein